MDTAPQRQTYDDSDDWDRPVQAPRLTDSCPKNETENARTLCNRFGWRFNEHDAVTEDNTTVIAESIEDVAAAMVDLGWIMPVSSGWRTNWSALPRTAEGAEDEVAAAEAIRGKLQDGHHLGWRQRARNK